MRHLKSFWVPLLFMKVTVAKKAGFCWGVRRAVNIVLDAKKKSAGKVYTYGPLIHNSIVIDELKGKGIDVYKEGDSISAGSLLVIRAHGIPPQTCEKLKSSGYDLINATCPHVIRAQQEVEKYYKKKYSILIAGDKNHAEVAGLLGFADNNATVVGALKDIENIRLKEPILFLAQTTFNLELFEKMKKELLGKYSDITVADTICLSTAERQNELIELSKTVESIVVVGDNSSANTMRLVAIAKETSKPIFFIQRAEELDMEKMKVYSSVGITAGASTPDSVTNEVVRRLERL